jgi:hypothetical protein
MRPRLRMFPSLPNQSGNRLSRLRHSPQELIPATCSFCTSMLPEHEARCGGVQCGSRCSFLAANKYAAGRSSFAVRWRTPRSTICASSQLVPIQECGSCWHTRVLGPRLSETPDSSKRCCKAQGKSVDVRGGLRAGIERVGVRAPAKP